MKTILFLLGLSLFFGWWVLEHRSYETIPPNITKELKANVNQSYLEGHITQALKEERLDNVQMYVGLAKMLDINLSTSLQEHIQEENSFFKKSWRNARDFGSGFLTGKADSAVGLGGSIASDMTLIGDLRDLKIEGTNYYEGKPYDKFILELSLIGVGLSATQLLSAGASTPLKVGASVMKVAKKSGKLSKPFMKLLSKRLSKTVDVKVLKTLDAKSLLHLQDTSKVVTKSIDLKPVKGLFNEVGEIKKFTSTADTISLLKYVDNTNDLRKISKISKTYKTNTKGVMKVLGKGALRAGKSVIKVTSELIVGVIGFVLSVFGFFGMLFMKWSFVRRVKGVVS